MAKISQAEKNRRKEAKIFAQLDRILELLEDGYQKQNPNRVHDQWIWLMGFNRGVYCSSGIGMYRKLSKRLDDWHRSHAELVEKYDKWQEHKKQFGAYEKSLRENMKNGKEADIHGGKH